MLLPGKGQNEIGSTYHVKIYIAYNQSTIKHRKAKFPVSDAVFIQVKKA